MTPAGRVCPVPGCPTILHAGQRRCPTHAAEYERRRGSRQARGYDAAHDRTRAMLATTGPLRCATCGAPLDTFDLGHTPSRNGYIGPQCWACNRGDGGRRASHNPETR